jgi:uncharacterized membrane protein YesL
MQQNKLKDSLLRFFHDLFDLMVVNCLWLLCSLPVFTVGPATCGLYAVTLKLVREESVHPVKDFFRGLKENLKSGFLLWLMAILLAVAVAGDVWLALQLSGGLRTLYMVVAVMVGAILMILITYTFALQAMFENPLKAQIANAFKLSAVAPGKTILMWFVLLIPVTAALILPPIALRMLGFLYLVAGISGPVYGASHILRNIFNRVNDNVPETVSPNSE